MGLQYDNLTGNTRVEKRMTVDIVGTTESSSGITFGAKLRIRSNETAGFLTGARVYLQTNGFEVGMGNINGAIEWMPGVYDASLGLTGLGWGGLVTNTAAKGYFNWDAYSSSGNGSEGVEVMYSSGAFSGHVSYSDTTLSSGAVAPMASGADHKRVAAYGAYTFGDWTAALGFQKSSVAQEDKIVLTVAGKVGDYGVGFAAADNDGVKKVALNGSATFGATTVSAYVADENSVAAETAYGLGLSYDLGGASVVGGVSHSESGVNRADLGVSFSF